MIWKITKNSSYLVGIKERMIRQWRWNSAWQSEYNFFFWKRFIKEDFSIGIVRATPSIHQDDSTGKSDKSDGWRRVSTIRFPGRIRLWNIFSKVLAKDSAKKRVAYIANYSIVWEVKSFNTSVEISRISQIVSKMLIIYSRNVISFIMY